MTKPLDLTQVETHFAFGENWASYAKEIGEREIDEAVVGLRRLFGDSLAGARFLDIGCGSGLHSLAALKLGASEVLSTDIDADSVRTTRSVVGQAETAKVRVEQISVFDLSPRNAGTFDVVYSWGVLHHTGDLHRAIEKAASLVKPDGLFAFALYRRTWMCWFWRWEKRWYVSASKSMQSIVRRIYIALYAVGKTLQGKSFRKLVREYRNARGMDFYHDVHDWMGGYPYESISPKDVERVMTELGFQCLRDLSAQGGILRRNVGMFGSGCDEYVYQRKV